MNTCFFLLFTSGICDVGWNLCLKQSKGITDWLINIIGVSCLIIGIITFKKALSGYPLSVAIVIWFGITFSLTTVADVFLFKTVLNFKVIFFMLLCAASIIGLNYFSSSE
jgi:multidrug transporter EmrE-like cation transporter